MRKLICWVLIGSIFTMIGCTPIRSKTPLSSCPMPQKMATFDNGTIFKAGGIRPLFEDRRARNVGDELTITIGESSNPTEKSSANAKKPSTPETSLPTDSKEFKSAAAKEKAGTTAYAGSVIATVVVVLDNGKLLVCGDKLVKYANADLNFEYVRISGIVNPLTISPTNTVQSTQIADVQIEYRNADNINPTPPSQSFMSRFSRMFTPKQLYF
ncbi:MAG: flagellar basal body L-ring protein FlgH [Gallionellaceae bacterium]